jgi:hypothetical protein
LLPTNIKGWQQSTGHRGWTLRSHNTMISPASSITAECMRRPACLHDCGDPAYHCMCSMQVVDITPMKHHLTSITSIRVVQQKHRRSKVGA